MLLVKRSVMQQKNMWPPKAVHRHTLIKDDANVPSIPRSVAVYTSADTSADTSAKITPAPLLLLCSVLDRHPAPSTRRCCPAQRIQLRGLSPRPIPAGVLAFRSTPKNVGRQGLRQASGSICWKAARRVEWCNKSGHGSGRRRGAFAWPHAHHEASYADATSVARRAAGASPHTH